MFVRVRAGRGVTKGLRGSFVCHSYLVICFETRVVTELSFLKSFIHEDIIINFRIFSTTFHFLGIISQENQGDYLRFPHHFPFR